jgi:multidrug efflux system outer membrane protein
MDRAALVRSFAALALAAAAAGCALESPPGGADLRKDALAHAPLPPAWKGGDGSEKAQVDRWLGSFNDPALSALVDEAESYNADLRTAAARVEQAQALLKVASAPLLPSVSLIGIGSGKSSSNGSGLNGVFLNASLELDIWGRLRYGEAAAQAQAAAVDADYAYARQSLAAMVAKGWFVAVEAGLQRAIVASTLRASQELLRLAKERQRVGPGNELEVADASANVETTKDMLRQSDLAREQALRALELLVGRYPAGEVAVASSLATMPPPVPAGLPSQLLERRPDVVAAERRVAIAFNQVGESKAAMLPRISLTAGGSSISSDLFVLQDRNNPVWGLGANLVAPLYQGGALQAQVEVRSAEQKAAVAAYASAGLRAFGEVENALAAENALRERALLLDAALRDNARALELAQVQYRVGTIDLRAIERRQLALYSTRTARLRVQSEQLAQRVNLHLALGGGFDDKPAVQTAQGM